MIVKPILLNYVINNEMQIINLEHHGNNFNGIYFDNLSPKGSILICPAMGITAKYYGYLASWLSAQGFLVMVIDYIGTGTSENLIRQPIDFNDWIKNIEIAGRWLKQHKPNIPLIFLGHSIGSQLYGFVEDTNLFNKAVFLASSTGYWKDGHSPQKWINYFLLSVILPLSNLVWGYTNAKFFKQGENYPKKIALQWRKWCLDRQYLSIDLLEDQHNNYHCYRGKITSIWFSDDPIANEITVPKLVSLYKKAEIELVKINSATFRGARLGHSGFLSRKFSKDLWGLLLASISV